MPGKMIAMEPNQQEATKQQRIWQIVAMIPPGKVASYGQVTTLAGLSGAARLVGHVLKNLPSDTQLPWHRVVNSQGKISLPEESASYQRQCQLLSAEGIVLKGGRISLKCYRWTP
jgi:methylated-DNA-protein-cysteine methyltransferase-like protein